ncbi:MAG TPA: hypothetical protein VJI69_04245 [Bacteroidia bacterium]|nr:hypothetical protein [Bacteroidia bacterium]
MQPNKNVQTQFATINLLNDPTFKSFLRVQQAYGIAQRGGTKLPFVNNTHLQRITSDVNILGSSELNVIIFENYIGKN